MKKVMMQRNGGVAKKNMCVMGIPLFAGTIHGIVSRARSVPTMQKKPVFAYSSDLLMNIKSYAYQIMIIDD
jgi:hypothetical protein